MGITVRSKTEDQNTHCCESMAEDIENTYCPIRYVKKYREYLIELRQSTGGIKMAYCFSCGTILPESLRNLWFDILEKEYSLESPLDNDKEKIPAEFQTDEWWKKRGL
jgi:hypothetical protein